MSDVKWIKLTTNMFDDEKIRLIESMPDADAVLVIWVKLLVQAGRTNANGYIFLNENIPYTDEMLATIFNRPLNTVRLALKTFKEFGMIEWDSNGICVANWEKHQNIEGLDKIREQNRLRQAKYRDKQKLLPESNVTVTSHNAIDIELDKELDKDKDIKIDRKKIPPQLEDVKKYCHERNNGIDAEHFIDYYQARNWFAGKVKMKDWQAAIRTWERNNQDTKKSKEVYL